MCRPASILYLYTKRGLGPLSTGTVSTKKAHFERRGPCRRNSRNRRATALRTGCQICKARSDEARGPPSDCRWPLGRPGTPRTQRGQRAERADCARSAQGERSEPAREACLHAADVSHQDARGTRGLDSLTQGPPVQVQNFTRSQNCRCLSTYTTPHHASPHTALR